MKTRLFIAPAAFLACIPYLAAAQDTLEEFEALIQERIAASSIVVDGSVNPESIPYGEKMAAAFRFFGREQEAAGDEAFRRSFNARYGGTSADAQRISQYVLNDAPFRKGVHALEKRELERFCGELLEAGESMGALEIGERLMAIEDRRLARLEQHYRGAVDGLGAATRSSLVSHVEATIVPGMTYGRIDYTALAAQAPDFLREWITDSCRQQDVAQPSSRSNGRAVQGLRGTQD